MNRPFMTTLLSSENSMRLSKGTIAEQLQKKGIEHLWAEFPHQVDTVVLHAMSAVERNPEAPFSLDNLLQIFIDYEVSAHFLILRDGVTHQLVPLTHMAWHAGGSRMPDPDGRTAVNQFSFGIELAGGDTTPFTDEQYKSLTQLLLYLDNQFPISTYVGHSTISGEQIVKDGLRTCAKTDPGPYFDWTLLPTTILAKCVVKIKDHKN